MKIWHWCVQVVTLGYLANQNAARRHKGQFFVPMESLNFLHRLKSVQDTVAEKCERDQHKLSEVKACPFISDNFFHADLFHKMAWFTKIIGSHLSVPYLCL